MLPDSQYPNYEKKWLFSDRETPSRAAPKSNDARHADGKASPYSALREVIEHHETQLQSLLNGEFQRGRAAQQRESETGLGDLLRAEDRARKAEKERDVARAELSSLRRDVEQLLDDARKDGEATGAARALEDLFAAARGKYPKSDLEAKSSTSIEIPNTSVPLNPGPSAKSPTIFVSEPQHRVERPSARPVVTGFLSDVLANLAPPMRIKSRKQSLPKWFVETVMCKNDQVFSTKSPDNKRLEVVEWRTIIRIDSEIHESAPDFHKHGALTFVQGEPNSGLAEKMRADRVGNEKVESYPAFRYWKDPRTSADGYYYIGHYKVNSLETIPRQTWDTWPLSRKRQIVRNFLLSAWGADVLRQKAIAMTLNRSPSDVEIEEMIDELLHIFYREEEPKLVMQHTILKQTQFCFRQCQKLAFEFDFDENGHDNSQLKRDAAAAGFAEDHGGGKKAKQWRDSEDSDDLYEASQ